MLKRAYLPINENKIVTKPTTYICEECGSEFTENDVDPDQLNMKVCSIDCEISKVEDEVFSKYE